MGLLTDWKSIGSLLGTVMFFRTIIHEFLPPELYTALIRFLSKVFTFLRPTVSILIEEFDNYNTSYDLFDAVQTYLSTKCYSSAQVLKLTRSRNSKNLTFNMHSNQDFEEIYDGFKVKWSLLTIQKKNTYTGSDEARYFELSFHRKYKEKVQSSYIPHVLEVAEKIKFQNRNRYLYTNRSSDETGRLWSPVPFAHPSTFDTIAIDPILKQEIKEDLMKFVNREQFYNRVGRAWKRGYLLYGPPGTGKTSLIAAIANFLKFDIFDLELTAVSSNSQLRKLLVAIPRKSVIVVEDIDCSLNLSERAKKDSNIGNNGGGVQGVTPTSHGKKSAVSLSGVLNFVDGLWSSCGGERLIIFTTNHKEKLDQALLRSGRMDKHINLSYCEVEAFKVLMKNYLDIDEHGLMEEVEKVLPCVQITPADIAEVFMGCVEDPDMGMENVVEVMKARLHTSTAAEHTEEKEKEECVTKQEEEEEDSVHEEDEDSDFEEDEDEGFEEDEEEYIE